MSKPKTSPAFSLVEVVLALGVVSFALMAILGVFPVGLKTARTSQDETRAAQLAQGIFASISAQASTQFPTVQIPVNGSTTVSLNLNASSTPSGPQIYANNDGNLTTGSANAVYAITISTSNTPAGISDADAGLASQVTIVVAWPSTAPSANQTRRSFVQIISKY